MSETVKTFRARVVEVDPPHGSPERALRNALRDLPGDFELKGNPLTAPVKVKIVVETADGEFKGWRELPEIPTLQAMLDLGYAVRFQTMETPMKPKRSEEPERLSHEYFARAVEKAAVLQRAADAIEWREDGPLNIQEEYLEMARLLRQAQRDAETLALINELADPEVQLLTLYGGNPSFMNDKPSYLVGVSEGSSGEPIEQEFGGSTLLDALRKAKEATSE